MPLFWLLLIKTTAEYVLQKENMIRCLVVFKMVMLTFGDPGLANMCSTCRPDAIEMSANIVHKYVDAKKGATYTCQILELQVCFGEQRNNGRVASDRHYVAFVVY